MKLYLAEVPSLPSLSSPTRSSRRTRRISDLQRAFVGILVLSDQSATKKPGRSPEAVKCCAGSSHGTSWQGSVTMIVANKMKLIQGAFHGPVNSMICTAERLQVAGVEENAFLAQADACGRRASHQVSTRLFMAATTSLVHLASQVDVS